MAPHFHSVVAWTEKSSKAKAEKLPVIGKETRTSMGEDDAFEDNTVGNATPLSAVADAFEPLSALVKSRDVDFDLSLKPFCEACSLVSVLFGCLGIAFKFAHSEYVSKVHHLDKASEVYGTLNNILDYDVENGTVRSPGSLSRNLRRVRQVHVL